jgi:aryl-alcohol dehydrogenase-like predicted oxidoreductase
VIERVRHGRTELEVGRNGLGGGNEIEAADVEYAVDRGINYLFTSCDLHAGSYGHSHEAIRRLCGHGAKRRDDVVLAACSYVNDPGKLFAVLLDQIASLGVDYVDVFQRGWMTKFQSPHIALEATDRVLRSETSRAFADSVVSVTRQVGDELYRRGYARHIGVSTHDRALARALIGHPSLDVLMVRYNRAHPGAEEDIFPFLGDRPPGIVAFNTAYDPDRRARDPDELSERYRFALRRPEIDVVLTGPTCRADIDAALAALEPVRA